VDPQKKYTQAKAIRIRFLRAAAAGICVSMVAGVLRWMGLRLNCGSPPVDAAMERRWFGAGTVWRF
jgi:hypothetical protein